MDGGRLITAIISFPKGTDKAKRYLFTGIACYFNVTYGLWLRYCRDGKKDEVDLVLPSVFGSIPVVERRVGGVRKAFSKTKSS